MRRSLAVLTVFVLLLSYFAFLTPKTAAAADQVCFVFEAGLTNNDTVAHTATVYFFDLGTLGTMTGTSSLTLQPGESGTLRLAAFVDAGVSVGLGGGPGGLDITSFRAGPADDSECGPGMINDGRINPYDLAAPLAAYCTADKGIEIWDIDDTGKGTLAFTVTRQQITDALAKAESSGQNVLIAEGMGDSLYALTSGELTLVGPEIKEPGKTYQRVVPSGVCS